MAGPLLPWKRPAWVPDLQQELSDLMSKFFGAEAGGEWLPPSPAVDISETEKEIVVKAEVPGIDPGDLDISLSGDVLTIRGEKKQEKEEKEEGRHRVERVFGSFSRSFTLPVPVQEDNIQAGYKNGLLTLTLPKAESAQKKSIKINVE
jgi:HSP20 family protein